MGRNFQIIKLKDLPLRLTSLTHGDVAVLAQYDICTVGDLVEEIVRWGKYRYILSLAGIKEVESFIAQIKDRQGD